MPACQHPNAYSRHLMTAMLVSGSICHLKRPPSTITTWVFMGYRCSYTFTPLFNSRHLILLSSNGQMICENGPPAASADFISILIWGENL